MKTKNLLASMFMVSMSAAFVVGCNNNKGPVDPVVKPPIVDTVPFENIALLPEFGITMADICNHAGEYSIEFTPNADWTFTSETNWLEVVTKSGTANDKVLKIKATGSNTSKDSRAANTKLKIGNNEYPLTITQMGDRPEIKVFSNVIELSSKALSGVIRNVVANCDIEITNQPEWVSNVQIVTVEQGFRYNITFDLAPNNYDNSAREGYITIKDKASSFTYDILVKCKKFTDAGFVDPSSAESVESKVISGVTNDERSFQIKFNNNPTNDADEDPLTLALFLQETNDWTGKVSYTKHEGTVARINSIGPRAEFDQVNFKVTLPKFKNPFGPTSATEIKIALFPVLESEVDYFDPVTAEMEPSVVVTQKMMQEVEPLYNLNQIKIEYQKPLSSSFILKYLVRNSAVNYGIKIGNDTGDQSPFTASEPSEKPSVLEGWKEVTYVITYDPTVVVNGLVNFWDAKSFYAAMYTGEFTDFTTEKASYHFSISTSANRWIEAPDLMTIIKSNNESPYTMNVVINAVENFDAETALTFSGKVWDANANNTNGAEVDKGPDYEYPGTFTFDSMLDLGALKIATYKATFNPSADYKFAFKAFFGEYSEYQYTFSSIDGKKVTKGKISVEK